ncbi:MAG TPA: zinc-binding dehydrogenase [Burkholderiales bacterium]|nr:zinc-binding dehydrogenase [Burkholderiales bacterium]
MRHTRIVVTRYGGPEAIRVLEEDRPEPKDGEARVRVLAAGVSLPDIMAREGIHPETPPVPFTPGWDLVGVVDRLGEGVSGIEPGQTVAAMPIHGAYAEFVCLPQRELVPVPSGLDAAEAVCLILNYITADFVSEIRRLTGEGVDVVFDSMGGAHIWRSREALRRGGKVVAYGLTGSLRGGRLASGRSGRRNRFGPIAIFALYIAASWLLPGRRRVVPYSIQTLKRLRPALFRQDLIALLDLLRQRKLKPLIARRLPLAQARQAHELLGKGGIAGKIVLVCNGSSPG